MAPEQVGTTVSTTETPAQAAPPSLPPRGIEIPMGESIANALPDDLGPRDLGSRRPTCRQRHQDRPKAAHDVAPPTMNSHGWVRGVNDARTGPLPQLPPLPQLGIPRRQCVKPAVLAPLLAARHFGCWQRHQLHSEQLEVRPRLALQLGGLPPLALMQVPIPRCGVTTSQS